MTNERPAIAPTAETYLLAGRLLRPAIANERAQAGEALRSYFLEYGPSPTEQLQLHGAESALLFDALDRLASLQDRDPVELLDEMIRVRVEKLNH